MATTEPLTGATVYQQTDAALGGQQLGDVVGDLAPFTIPRFTSTSTRDTQYAAFVAAGGVIKNGMVCWCDAPGSYYDRIGGAWVPRASVTYNTVAIDGTAVPATARMVQVRTTQRVTVSNTSGGFACPYGFSFTKLVAVALSPGDTEGGLAYVTPIILNHTLTTANGQARRADSSAVPNGTIIRVEVDAIGYI